MGVLLLPRALRDLWADVRVAGGAGGGGGFADQRHANARPQVRQSRLGRARALPVHSTRAMAAVAPMAPAVAPAAAPKAPVRGHRCQGSSQSSSSASAPKYTPRIAGITAPKAAHSTAPSLPEQENLRAARSTAAARGCTRARAGPSSTATRNEPSASESSTLRDQAPTHAALHPGVERANALPAPCETAALPQQTAFVLTLGRRPSLRGAPPGRKIWAPTQLHSLPVRRRLRASLFCMLGSWPPPTGSPPGPRQPPSSQARAAIRKDRFPCEGGSWARTKAAVAVRAWRHPGRELRAAAASSPNGHGSKE